MTRWTAARAKGIPSAFLRNLGYPGRLSSALEAANRHGIAPGLLRGCSAVLRECCYEGASKDVRWSLKDLRRILTWMESGAILQPALSGPAYAACEPSQKGLLADLPHRQRVSRFRTA